LKFNRPIFRPEVAEIRSGKIQDGKRTHSILSDNPNAVHLLGQNFIEIDRNPEHYFTQWKRLSLIHRVGQL
jgi:hypothetical protein